MTPMTPSGWYSTVEAWLMAMRPLRTRRAPSTLRAFLAAQSICTIARMISSWASASGLPVSVCTSSASRAMYLVMWDFQARSRVCRSFQSRRQICGEPGALDGSGDLALPHRREGSDHLGRRGVDRVESLCGPSLPAGPHRGAHVPHHRLIQLRQRHPRETVNHRNSRPDSLGGPSAGSLARATPKGPCYTEGTVSYGSAYSEHAS